VVVVGGSSQIRHFLLPRLVNAGYPVTVFTRGEHASNPDVRWVTASHDGLGDAIVALGHCPTLIWLAPLPALPALFDKLVDAGVQRVIAFGTTSRFYKGAASSSRDRDLATRMACAEEALGVACADAGVAITLFRPTLVYGCGMDENVMFIASTIRRFGFFPVVGGGAGLRQPVHADDLAAACLSALERPESFGKAYNLSGGSTLSYRDMVVAIFKAMGRTPRIVDVPVPLLRFAIRCARLLPGLGYLSADMADRISRDLCFEHGDAVRDLGYAPRAFTLDSLALGARA